MSALDFENLFFIILSVHILYMEYPFGHSYGTTYKAQLSIKNRRTEAVSELFCLCCVAVLKSLPALSDNALIIPILRIVCTISFHYICPWLNSWLSFVVSNCEFVAFSLESWVRCGT